MRGNLNELIQPERRLELSPLPGRPADVAVLLMQPAGELPPSPVGFIGPVLGRPVALRASMKLIPERAGSSSTRAVHAVQMPRDIGRTHWGLNE